MKERRSGMLRKLTTMYDVELDEVHAVKFEFFGRTVPVCSCTLWGKAFLPYRTAAGSKSDG